MIVYTSKGLWFLLVLAFLTACSTVTPTPISTTSTTTVVDGTHESTTLPVGDIQHGEALFNNGRDKAPACRSCHTTGSDQLVGPGLGGISTRGATRIAGLSAGAYVRFHILHPGEFVVTGYPNLMPKVYGKALSEQDVADLVAYLLTLP